MLTRPRQGRERSSGVAAGRGHHESLRLLDDPAVLDHLDHLLGALRLAGPLLQHRRPRSPARAGALEAPRCRPPAGRASAEEHDEPACVLLVTRAAGRRRQRAPRPRCRRPRRRPRAARSPAPRLRGVAVRHLARQLQRAGADPEAPRRRRRQRPPTAPGTRSEQLLEHRPQQALARLPHGHDHHPRPADAIPSATSPAPLPTPSGIASADSCPLGGLNQTSFGDVYRWTR